MVERTKPYRNCGELEVVLVDIDDHSSASKLKKSMQEAHVDFPVLYYGERMDSPPAREWHISGAPRGFLVDPQGVIVAHPIPRYNSGLIEMYEMIRSQGGQYSQIGVRTSRKFNDDGLVELSIELYSPQRLPLQVKVDYTLPSFEWDIETEKLSKSDRYRPSKTEPEFEFEVEFPDTSEQIVTLPIDASGYSGLEFSVKVLIPGTEELNEGEGVWNYVRGEVYFPTGIPDVDEFYASYPRERF